MFSAMLIRIYQHVYTTSEVVELVMVVSALHRGILTRVVVLKTASSNNTLVWFPTTRPVEVCLSFNYAPSLYHHVTFL